jgi:lipopolysaccharide assembly protein A
MLELEEYWKSLTVNGKIKFVAKIIVVILSILFAVFNWQTVELHLIFLKVNVPLTLLIVICVVIGLIISSIFDYRRFQQKDREIRRLKKELGEE